MCSGVGAMSEDEESITDDDFWDELFTRGARLLSTAAVGSEVPDVQHASSSSAQAEAQRADTACTENLRMLRARLLNTIGDRHVAQQFWNTGSRAVCHDWDRPLRVSLQMWEHLVLGLVAVTNGMALPEPPSHFLTRREREVLKRHVFFERQRGVAECDLHTTPSESSQAL